MNEVLEEIIRKKPHLTDPLRFYEKVSAFTDAVRSLPIPAGQDAHAYPREFLERIFRLFSTALELPHGNLAPLLRALELGEIDFTRLPALEVPAFALPYPEDDCTMLLFLLSRPYFIGLRARRRMDDRSWEEGKCPVCGSHPTITSPARQDRKALHCSFCGTAGRPQRIGCPVCLTGDGAKLQRLSFQGEEGIIITTCAVCRSYGKAVDKELINRTGPDIADLMSLPLDIVVQEKGFKRPSPNPLGMVRMSARG